MPPAAPRRRCAERDGDDPGEVVCYPSRPGRSISNPGATGPSVMQQNATYIGTVVPTLVFLTVWFVIGLAIFGSLHRICGARKQPFWRSDMKADLAYWFVGPLLYGYVAFVARACAVDYAHLDRIALAAPALADWPIWLQALVILFITDVVQYWGHRLFHRNPLWRFHCIHHAPIRVDWLTAVRIHPVNFVLYSTLINVLVGFVGFSPRAFIYLVPFNMLFGLLVHANLNWTFGPFRYALASPVFHRWHHTYGDGGGSKNFAPTFPFLDLAFGTFHMPKGELPTVFGITDGQVPNHLLGQVCYPFRRRKRLAA
jgi:sterol desaturase/sphingolipid hydroxylase (fatty acid hydroxylase superfamily)